MNAKERKRAKLMYRFPLLLALTGLVLLLLQWALGFASMDAFGELLPLVQRNWYILVLPVALLLLYLFRAPVAAAYGGAAVGAVLFLIQLVVSFLLRRSGGDAAGLAAWIPGHGLFSSLRRAGVSGEHFGFCHGSCPGAMQRLDDLLLYGLCQRAAPGDRAGHPTAGPARRRKRFFPGRLTQAQGRAILISS